MFSDPEKKQIGDLVGAGIYIRTAIRAMESAIAVSSTPETRPVLVSMIHPLLEADEGAAACLGLLAGAIVARGEAEKVSLRLQPRDVFLGKAMAGLDRAISEASEARDLFQGLLTGAMPGDANVALSLFNIKRALVRLTGFNKSLAYADPTGWPGVDPIQQRDAQTHLWRSGGQYLYDSLSGILDGYAADTLLPAQLLLALKDILGFGWLIEDDLQKCAARFMGIQWIPGEEPLHAAHLLLLNDTSPRFQFGLTYLVQLLSFDAVLGRPEMQKLFIVAGAKWADAWKRADYAASLCPVLGDWVNMRNLEF